MFHWYSRRKVERDPFRKKKIEKIMAKTSKIW